MQSRRAFIVSASACATTPLALGLKVLSAQGRSSGPAGTRTSDPVLLLIGKELARIESELRQGDRSPAPLRAMESTLRFQAIHFKKEGYDTTIASGVRHRINEIGRAQFIQDLLSADKLARPARDTEFKRRFPMDVPPLIPPPSYEDLAVTIEVIEREGLSPRFLLQADALKVANESMRPGLGQGWLRPVRAESRAAAQGWFCDWWGKSLAIDQALLTMTCGMAVFLGVIAETLCGLYAIEVGLEMLVFEAVC